MAGSLYQARRVVCFQHHCSASHYLPPRLMDFLQDAIATVHNYGREDGQVLAHLESRLRRHPTWILIPCLFEGFSVTGTHSDS